MNMNVVAVDVKHMCAYDFLQDGETIEELQNRVENYRLSNIESWNENRKYHPCESYEQHYQCALECEYKIMSYSEFNQMQRDFYLNKPLTETTEEDFNEMLNVLPPMKWCTIDGVEMFCMCEMYTGTFTTQYAKCNGRYYKKLVDITDKSTWINNDRNIG